MASVVVSEVGCCGLRPIGGRSDHRMLCRRVDDRVSAAPSGVISRRRSPAGRARSDAFSGRLGRLRLHEVAAALGIPIGTVKPD